MNGETNDSNIDARSEVEKSSPMFSFEKPEYLAEHPIISRETLTISDHPIEIINYNPETPLDEGYLRQTQETLERIGNVAPHFVENYKKIFIIPEPGAELKAKDNMSYAPNGRNIRSPAVPPESNVFDGIRINQLGFRTDRPHRIGAANNFQGTLTHEMGHAVEWIDKKLLYLFMNELGYHSILGEWNEEKKSFNLLEGWEKLESGGYLNKKNNYFTREGSIPTQPELVPTEYGRQLSIEDFCDSFVAYLYSPDTLDGKRRAFFEKNFPQRIKETGH